MTQKRGLFVVLLGLILLLFSFAFLAQEDSFSLITGAAAEDLVNCGTAEGCSFTTQTDCDAQGGTAVTSEEEETLCSPGCCQIFPTNFCEYGVEGIRCQKLAERDLGSSVRSSEYQYTPVTSQEQCLRDVCELGEVASAQLIVIVKDQNNALLPNAEVVLLQAGEVKAQARSDSEGKAFFTEIKAGLYSLSIGSEGLQTATFSLSLTPGDTLTREVILRPPGKGTIAGTVYCSEGETSTLSEGATVSWKKGSESGILTPPDGTSSDGKYDTSVNYLTGLEEGTYTLFATADCGSGQLTVTLSGEEHLTGIDFIIHPQAFQGVQGKVTLNNILIPGARLYVDGAFVRRTEGPPKEGEYRITLPADGRPHTISALYADYYKSQEVSFLLNDAQPEITVDLLLERIAGECSPEKLLEVNSFSASAVPDEEEVFLQWEPPNCPDNIQGYHVVRTQQGSSDSRTDDFTVPVTSFTDSDVVFGQTYTYIIYVMYHFDTSLDILPSPTGLFDDVALGFEECFERNDFCSLDSASSVLSCTEDGRIDESATLNCPDGTRCGSGASGSAVCRTVDVCSQDSDNKIFADPFGLFYDRETCYGGLFAEGTKPSKFCTYDTKISVGENTLTSSFSDPRVSTTVNGCLSCTEIGSCFDYQSKDACEVNSCRVENCRWIDAAQNKASVAESSGEDSGVEEQEAQQVIDYGILGEIARQVNLAQSVTQETGAGYCVQENYGKDKNGQSKSSGYGDACDLCDARRQPFEDYFCTAQVCSNLGRCFSTAALDTCNSCGDAPKIDDAQALDNTCYGYKTELECTAGKPISSSNDAISPSADQCGWNRCLWTGATNFAQSENTGCVKDGDVNGKDDCYEDLQYGARPLDLKACKQDNSPPRTILEGTLIPSSSSLPASGSSATPSAETTSSASVSSEEPANLPVKSTPLPTVSLAFPKLVFRGDDEFHSKIVEGEEENILKNQQSFLDYFAYCLLPAGTDTPVVCTAENFENPVSYLHPVTHQPYKKNAQIIVSPLSKITKAVDGELYKIRYYSQDQYRNRESVKESFIFVDNVKPEFLVNRSIVTKGDTSWLTVWLEDPSELMSCSFTLFEKGSEIPQQAPIIKTKEEAQKAEFTSLPNIVAVDLNITCTDVSGNVNSKVILYTFDLEEKINILSPEEFESSTILTFAVDTTVEAECTLRKSATNELVAPFQWIDANPKKHLTSPLSGFLPREYAADYKVVCDAFADIDNFEDYFHFTVDTSPPKTKITLREGAREVVPLQRVWEDSFIASAEVTLECLNEGIPCVDIMYCTGDEHTCQPLPGTTYQKYVNDPAAPSAPLKFTESTRICYYSTDQAGNKVFSANCGKINIVGYGITLELPEPYTYENEIYGLSREAAFTWQFFTKVPTEECRFAFTANFPYDDVPPFHILSPDTQGKYRLENFPSSAFQEFPNDGGEKTVFVRCKSLGGELSPEQKFILEYDPFTPTILQSYAEPATIYEGTKTHIFDVTDRKTFCKYSDNSEDAGSNDFSSMEFSFPGFTEGILHRNHEDIFSLNSFSSTNGQKNYVLNTQCRSGAGIVSELAQITFFVDYSEQGFIIAGSLLPEGFVVGPDVPISVQTSKSAECKYRFSEVYTPFTETGGTTHTAVLTDLGEGEYVIPVKCTLAGGHVVEDKITFTLDYTGPEITNITDGTLTCGAEFIEVFIYSTENTVARYFYTLFNRGNQSVFTEKAEVILPGEHNDSIPYDQPLQIPTATLQENHFYTAEVQGIDRARNKGPLKESDGVRVVSANNSACLSDTSPPKVTVLFGNETCSATQIEFRCEDATACKNFTYFTTEEPQGCNFTSGNITSTPIPLPLAYGGQKLSADRNKWFCYKVEDMRGNGLRDQKYVSFADVDGDKVADSCDICPDSKAGKVVNEKGCASGDVPKNETPVDDDGDGLSGYCERQYNSATCLLDETNPDSDNDGIGDGAEDYDNDGNSNFEECFAGSDPCFNGSRPEPRPPGPEPVPPKPIPGPPGPSPFPPGVEKSKVIAWSLLFIGLLMIFSGSGYLLYYYKSLSGSRRETPAVFGEEEKIPKEVSSQSKKPVTSERGQGPRAKARKRRELFGAFDQPPAEDLGTAAKKYKELPERKTLKVPREEKNVFSQLEKLAKKPGEKSGSEKKSAGKEKDLFSELRELTKKRKQK